MTTQIIEVIRRSEQGITQPYICRAEDGELYFVKGRGAGRRSQIAEWLAGHLALGFGLPIADFSLLEVDRNLIAGGPAWLADLGHGMVFGSRQHAAVQEFGLTHVPLVDASLQRDVLVFDWWVRNADRSLSDVGGNPNLCWDQAAAKLLLIDHNQAFDVDFDSVIFLRTHVFRSMWDSLDLVERSAYLPRFEQALARWPQAVQSIPTEWWYVDDEHTVPANVDLAMLLTTLQRYSTPQFWTLTR